MNAFYSTYSSTDVDVPYPVLDVPEPSPVELEQSEPTAIEIYRPPPPPPASQHSVSPVEADEKSAIAESSITQLVSIPLLVVLVHLITHLPPVPNRSFNLPPCTSSTLNLSKLLKSFQVLLR
jgi:hypothetical protein